MDRILTFRERRKLFFVLTLLALSFMNILVSYAQDASGDPFSDLIEELKQEGVIPERSGRIFSYGDYEITYSKTDHCSVTPLLEAKRFVFSADISWSSGNQTGNAASSGCGVVFNAAADSSDHVMVSTRLDGGMYVSGASENKYVTYAKFPYTAASSSGRTKLTVVADGAEAIIYLDGQQKSHRYNLPAAGNVVGLSVLSGTNQNPGTRCTFRNIGFYTW